jgi:hypothetical protein
VGPIVASAIYVVDGIPADSCSSGATSRKRDVRQLTWPRVSRGNNEGSAWEAGFFLSWATTDDDSHDTR